MYEVELKKISKEKYESYSNVKKKMVEAEYYKQAAINCGRRANAANREKDMKDLNTVYKRKVEFIKRFLTYTCKFNQMVNENDQIPFTITRDEKKGAVLLDAILLGYSRISLHLGSYTNYHEILLDVNTRLVGDGFDEQFPTFIDGKKGLRINDSIFEDEFRLHNFGIMNTGIVNKDDFNGASKYVERLKNKVIGEDEITNIEGFNEYINFMHTDCTNREIYELACKASFGKGRFAVLNDLLQDREDVRGRAIANKKTLREQYVYERIQKAKDDNEKRKIVNSLYDSYEMLEQKFNFMECFTNVGLPMEFMPNTKNEKTKIVQEKENKQMISNSIPRINNNKYSKYDDILKKKAKGANDTINKLGMQEYINFMYSDFDDDKIKELAQNANIGKTATSLLDKLLVERAKREKQGKQNGKTVQEQYVYERMHKTQDRDEKNKILNALYSSYEMCGKRFDFVKCLQNAGIKKDVILSSSKIAEEINIQDLFKMLKGAKRLDKFSEIFTQKFSNLHELDKTDFISEVVFENEEFSKENFVQVMKLADTENQKWILETTNEELELIDRTDIDLEEILLDVSVEEESKIFDNILDMYDQLKKNAQNVSPSARDKVNAIEEKISEKMK